MNVNPMPRPRNLSLILAVAVVFHIPHITSSRFLLRGVLPDVNAGGPSRSAVVTTQSEFIDNHAAANTLLVGTLEQRQEGVVTIENHHRRTTLTATSSTTTFSPSPSPRRASSAPPVHSPPLLRKTPTSKPSPRLSLALSPRRSPFPSPSPPSLPPPSASTARSSMSVCGAVSITGPTIVGSTNPFANMASCDKLAMQMVRELEDAASSTGAMLEMPFALDSCTISQNRMGNLRPQYTIVVCGSFPNELEAGKIQDHLGHAMSMWRYHALQWSPVAGNVVDFCPPLGYNIKTMVWNDGDGLPAAFLEINCSSTISRG